MHLALRMLEKREGRRGGNDGGENKLQGDDGQQEFVGV